MAVSDLNASFRDFYRSPSQKIKSAGYKFVMPLILFLSIHYHSNNIYIAQYHAYTEVRRVWLIGDPYINLIPCIVRNGPVHHIIFTSPPSKVDRTPTLHTCDQTPVDGLVGPKSYMVELELVPTYVETYLDTFRVKANFESISPTLFVRLSLLSRHLT
jgi:hypothetical protein